VGLRRGLGGGLNRERTGRRPGVLIMLAGEEFNQNTHKYGWGRGRQKPNVTLLGSWRNRRGKHWKKRLHARKKKAWLVEGRTEGQRRKRREGKRQKTGKREGEGEGQYPCRSMMEGP